MCSCEGSALLQLLPELTYRQSSNALVDRLMELLKGCWWTYAGMALGMVMQLPEEADEHSVSRRQLLAKLDVCMGGRAAEEMIFGEGDVTTGASSDLQQVCKRILSRIW